MLCFHTVQFFFFSLHLQLLYLFWIYAYFHVSIGAFICSSFCPQNIATMFSKKIIDWKFTFLGKGFILHKKYERSDNQRTHLFNRPPPDVFYKLIRPTWKPITEQVDSKYILHGLPTLYERVQSLSKLWLTHSFPMHLFSTPWKPTKTVKIFVFRR